MYGIGGEKRLREDTLGHLAGYEDARPVRVGNGAYDQDQHDVWGAVLDSVYLHTKSRDFLPERSWPHPRAPGRGGDRALARARPRHLGGARRAPALRVLEGRCAGWRSTAGRGWPRCKAITTAPSSGGEIAAEIQADVLANGVDERGVFTQHYDTDALDASNLLMPLVRFLPADDERIRATVLAIADELTVDGLVLRYKVDDTDDGLSGEEGTFTICSFWLVSRAGRDRRARRGRACCASGCSAMPARCCSTPRRSTPSPVAIWATSRRPSPTSR